MKKIIILFIVSIVSFSKINAEYSGFQELTENWLQQPAETTEPSRISPPTPDPELPGPVGEGCLILTVLAGGYSLVKQWKKLKSSPKIY